MEGAPTFEAKIGRGDVTFDARDASLLRAIDEAGSLNKAAESLGRSFAHAQRRIVELEEAFGPLVERRRGGPGGGGSSLTDVARDLLARLDRLQTEFSGVAQVAHTVLAGRVVRRDGELVTVETAAGEVRALVPEDATAVEVWIRADAVTLTDPDDVPEPEETSARNRFAGEVTNVDIGETIAVVEVDVGADRPLVALVTLASVRKLSLRPGKRVVASFKATATRGLPRPRE